MPFVRLFSASTFAREYQGEPVATHYFRAKRLPLRVEQRNSVIATETTLYHGNTFNHTVRAPPGNNVQGVLLTIEGDDPPLTQWWKDFDAFERTYGMQRVQTDFLPTEAGPPMPGTLYLLPRLEDYTGLDGSLEPGPMEITDAMVEEAIRRLAQSR